MNPITLQIEGMSCGHCVGQVRNAMARLDGVQIHEVKVGEASLSYDPALVSPKEIVEAVQAAGYDVSPAWRAA
jgi:copper chaperone CopZ